MLKGSVKSLIALVIALVATGILSTGSPARDLRSLSGPAVAKAVTPAKANPVTTSGEPDQPLSPPPPTFNGGAQTPIVESSADGTYWVVLRWTGWVWAYWFARVTF